ncbi:MAG: hypothetical protein GY906_20105, partial [bacterium]|nr:hypothetical protein [bacterium]
MSFRKQRSSLELKSVSIRCATFLLLVFGVLISIPAEAITPVYVRTDGSDTQCNGSVNVGVSGAPNCAVASLGQAMTLVDPSGEIIVGPGSFVDAAQLVIAQDVTITGAGMGATTIGLSFNTVNSGDARGWWLVN